MWQNWKSRPSCGPEYGSTGLTLQDACGDLGTPQDVERQDTTQVMCFHFFNVRDQGISLQLTPPPQLTPPLFQIGDRVNWG